MSGFAFPPGLSSAAQRAFEPERWLGNLAVERSDWVGLHQGDPCFPTPAHVVEAAFEAVGQGYTNYPPQQGDPDLRDAIAERASSVSVVPRTRDDILVSAGATAAIYAALSAYVEPGEEVLLFDPSYSLYAPIIRQIGGVPVYVPMTRDFRIDPERLKAAVTPATRMIVVNNPVNPTGTVFTRSELEAIARVAIAADALVLADEVYDHLVYDVEFASTLELPELADRLIYINSFSKTYAMTGWRIGWVAGAGDLVFGVRIIHANSVGTVNWPTQRAGLAALRGPQDRVAEMVEGYRARRDVLVDALATTPGLEIVPADGTFYAFVRVPAELELTSAEAAALLRGEGVGVRSGTEYGAAGEGYLRLSFAASLDDVAIGARRISDLFSRLGAHEASIAR